MSIIMLKTESNIKVNFKLNNLNCAIRFKVIFFYFKAKFKFKILSSKKYLKKYIFINFDFG